MSEMKSINKCGCCQMFGGACEGFSNGAARHVEMKSDKLGGGGAQRIKWLLSADD